MKRDGVMLYQEAESMSRVMGVLVSYCKPPNTAEVKTAQRAISIALNAMYKHFVESVRKEHASGERGSPEQKRYNYTISQLRDIKTYYRKKTYKLLKKNVWRG